MSSPRNTQTNASEELVTQYIADNVEPIIRSLWEKNATFCADVSSTKPSYCIVMPPPNVTGVLHMGHALVNTLQDILVRWKKMMGYEVLWLPGTDHAGIATQTVVERHLIQTQQKRRTDFSREEFLDHVWTWKEKSQKTILSQLQRLGCAADWSRLRFTMDEGSNKAVRHMFKLLFDKGLIYQGDYLVNWDTVSETALADDEVEYEERHGNLYTIRYPLDGSDSSLFIATTRPETLLADTAVAVHPKDIRYQAYIGHMICHPITGRKIPIVADDFVDPEFGTGVVKITPAHDPNDYQLAQRHNLVMINMLNSNGTVNSNGLSYEGMTVEAARKAIVAELTLLGFLTKTELHIHRVGVSYRSKAVIEPMLSKQWFIKLHPFKKVLREYVETKKVRLIPESWQQTYYQWIDNLRDWCISRQLWWGHQIPIWYNKQDRTQIICYDKDGLPPQVQENPDIWEQDPDVLDTWFSSGLWPFSTLGWPDNTIELSRFYPNATLITGHDILFFWVARMIMMSHFAFGDIPFKETFLHGLIYGKSYWRENVSGGISYVSEEERKLYDLGKKDIPKDVKSRWEKMSKSKGNILDPLEVIDEYGTDAMRLALAASATEARQIDLDRRRFEEWRNFANKVWNGARFVLMNISYDSGASLLEEKLAAPLSLEDRWILSRVATAAKNITTALEHYSFDKAATYAYEFYWNEFCAFYVELAKPALFGKKGNQEKTRKQLIALTVLLQSLQLLHPFAPYITEELFQTTKKRFSQWQTLYSSHHTKSHLQNILTLLHHETLSTTSYPLYTTANSDQAGFCIETERDFARMEAIVTQIRAIRGEMKILPSHAIDLYIKTNEPSQHRGNENSLFLLARSSKHILEALTRVQAIHFVDTLPEFSVSSKAIVEGIEIIVPLPENMKRQEIERLEKEIGKLHELIIKTQSQLSNKNFVERAPTQLVEKLHATLQQHKQEIKSLVAQRERLS